MFATYTQNSQKAVSAVAAVAIVAFGGLVMDQAHLASAPRGIVEVGELTLIGDAELAQIVLPEVVVLAKREQAGSMFAATTQLPEIVVVAKRVAQLVAATEQAGQPEGSAKVSAEGALLK